jgi:hypothetical protein
MKNIFYEKTQVLMYKDQTLYNTFNFKTPFQLYKAVKSYLRDKEYQIGTNEIYVGDITLYLGVVEYSTSL